MLQMMKTTRSNRSKTFQFTKTQSMEVDMTLIMGE
jgi:hypothetical protein